MKFTFDPKQFVVSMLVLIAIVVLFGSFYTVNSGQRAIVLTNGRVTSVQGDGLHFKTPLIQKVIKVDIRTLQAHAQASAGTNDLQSIHTEVSANYHLLPDQVGVIYSKFGLDVEDRIIDPRIQEVVKAVVAHYTAEQLLKQRDIVRGQIREDLSKMLTEYSILLEDIQITDFKFSKAFDEAIEAKQTAEQRALTAKNDLLRIQIEAQQAVATAEGKAKSNLAIAEADAKAISLKGDALRNNPGVAELNAIDKWDGALPQVSGGNTPFINLTK